MMLTGGGTGGHLFPGIALAGALRKRFPESKLVFIGTHRQLDQEILAGLDFEQKSIHCMGLKGMGTLQRVQSLASLPKAVLEARRLIKDFQPEVLVGLGGYVTGPVLLAARWLGIPSCIHEQNSIPGLANRWAARCATKIFVSIPGTYPFSPAKTLVTGNPVREALLKAARKTPDRPKTGQAFTLLVMGGSLGAHRLNLLLPEALIPFQKQVSFPFRVIHQTGQADCQQVQEVYQAAGIQAEVAAFFKDMAAVYKASDLVVARAGATTLAELAVMGLPALLIPYPYAADDHQAANAAYYVAGGGALMSREDELSAEKLTSVLVELAQAPETLGRMAQAMQRLAIPDAAERILDACVHLTQRGQGNV
jgi:UDP-N-acetylglucosamine--N-acetylmuramyl-(pentapeptide) pyrophosphoryl-undecaprenol N-acetylglucosamine transferase